ncbi:DUF2314 domain-containing protein [Phyllobacterium sp. OV277]|uniref:YegJ family protein n=1 Tax=Phyllobacterium sp. OV277 TaxID=1882772 RepID=UPI00088179F5|nr:DUF2314 domain-containing protein [Phyllobacterium sp. OV277]SDO58761.1 Uncharacterized conserved protein YegJ, DUF2314 family [Phyllobacterium sp. OV277]
MIGHHSLKRIACTILAVTLWVAALPAYAQSNDKVISVDNADPDMNAAIEQARKGLDKFIVLSKTPPKGTNGYKLKVMVHDGAKVEHFWVTPFHTTKDGFEGTLANEPEVVTNVTAGQNLKFTRNDISDWGYTKNGRQIGSYTVCVLFKKMTKEEADFYRNNYGFDC